MQRKQDIPHLDRYLRILRIHSPNIVVVILDPLSWITDQPHGFISVVVPRSVVNPIAASASFCV